MNETLEKVQNWLLTTGMDFAVALLGSIIILIVAKIVIGMVCDHTAKGLAKTGKMSELLQAFTVNVLNKVLWIIALMIAIQHLGVDVGPMIAGLGVTGFIIGFAFQQTLASFAAGFMIALNQPFKIGDFIDAGGITGTVKDMNMMAVTLNTPDNKVVIAPNGSIWGSPITNYSALDTRRVDMVVGISYGAPIGKARDIILDVLKSNDMVLPEPEPLVEVTEMADSSVNFVVRPWSKTADYWAVMFAVKRAIKEQFDANGIEIPFPQMDVHLDGGLSSDKSA